MKKILLPIVLLCVYAVSAQNVMTPELLWSLKRVGAQGVSDNGKYVYYSTREYDIQTEKSTAKHYRLNIATGNATEVKGERNIMQRDGNTWYAQSDNKIMRSTDEGNSWHSFGVVPEGAENIKVSPDGKHIAYTKEVLVKPVLGTDIYPDLQKNTAHIYTTLNYRHWDTWEDGKYSHLFVMPAKGGTSVDLIGNQPYDVPQKPFGGGEDFAWSPDSKGIVYVTKKKYGKDYAVSTNTDIYYYNLANGNTINWTSGMEGYDMHPVFSPDGKRIAWTSMAREGYEADKNDIYVMDLDNESAYKLKLTGHWDGTVSSFAWSKDGSKIYFNAPHRGTEQLYEVMVPKNLYNKSLPVVKKLTEGKFDINGIVGLAGNEAIVTRTDMNHASEIYAVNLADGNMRQLTHANDEVYNSIKMSNTELRMMETTDGRQMGVWVIYPPDFDPNKKYPTLLYCQGGPQSSLSQFYSFRWNFQLMAANGYIVVAPNRRGMPGWGVKWNEEISKDWGGQPMRDYLTAIDKFAEEDFVDQTRLGCIGASYGGYSVFMLAGMHDGRFKSFIAHDGLFDLTSWYGTTEELWFANWDVGGPYWKNPQPESYKKHNPINFVDKWDTPIMIIQGGIDFRVPIEQGLEAFQAAQLQGIKSKLLYFPNENHWVLHAQNGIVWQREFFKWLEETLK